MASTTPKFTSAIVLYHGIFYDASLRDTVRDALLCNPKYAPIAKDRELNLHGCSFEESASSDRDDDEGYAYLYVNEMTIDGGREYESPFDCMLNIDPHEMITAEKTYNNAVNEMISIFDYLVKHFKTKKLPYRKLHLGWRTVMTVLEDD